MQLFYNADIENSASQFVMNAEESLHIVKVLRKKVGDKLSVTNGKGYLFEVEIIDANSKRCKVQIIATTKIRQKSSWLHMAIAPTKSNDRFEWFLEKATEIGVNEITPVICDHSERKIVKADRMQKVVLAAMKQSLQTYLPKVNDPVTFKTFIERVHAGQLFIAHCQEEEKMELKRSVVPDNDITILIGPEGDFSTTEIQMALKNKFVPISLGENRLRTETAGVVACSIVNMINDG